MADKKIEKALYGPSLTEVALGAVLGFIVGIVAACAYLVFKPVQQVLVMPEKAKQSISVVYYLPGSESNADLTFAVMMPSSTLLPTDTLPS